MWRRAVVVIVGVAAAGLLMGSADPATTQAPPAKPSAADTAKVRTIQERDRWVLEPEVITVGPRHLDFTKSPVGRSDGIPGTDFGVRYRWGGWNGRFEIGDRVLFKCKLLAADTTSRPCDSVEVSVELGHDQLPVGLEWVLLSPADLTAPVQMRRELLDPRFLRCGGDSN